MDNKLVSRIILAGCFRCLLSGLSELVLGGLDLIGGWNKVGFCWAWVGSIVGDWFGAEVVAGVEEAGIVVGSFLGRLSDCYMGRPAISPVSCGVYARWPSYSLSRSIQWKSWPFGLCKSRYNLQNSNSCKHSNFCDVFRMYRCHIYWDSNSSRLFHVLSKLTPHCNICPSSILHLNSWRRSPRPQKWGRWWLLRLVVSWMLCFALTFAWNRRS